jgi:rfaE bifunctional protein nucleotidyltransferase chain/domain
MSAADSASKVVTLDALLAAVGDARRRGATIVTTNGCFDLLHVGHVAVLEAAAALGDLLIVGVNADATVTALKGPGRPLVPQAERARVVAALGCVDYVVIFEEPDPIALIEAVRPDVHVKGGDYPADIIEAPAVREGGGRVVIVPAVPGHSTAGLVRRIRGGAADIPEGVDH